MPLNSNNHATASILQAYALANYTSAFTNQQPDKRSAKSIQKQLDAFRQACDNEITLLIAAFYDIVRFNPEMLRQYDVLLKRLYRNGNGNTNTSPEN